MPDKFPDVPDRVKQDWIKAIEYEASLAPDFLLAEEFKFASSSKVALHLWPYLDPMDSRNTVEGWRKHPEYRRDIRLCCYKKILEKVTTELLARLRQDRTAE